MQWSYIFYIRERKNPNILYNILGLYRAVLVRELQSQFAISCCETAIDSLVRMCGGNI
jgi:hypothetical protein